MGTAGIVILVVLVVVAIGVVVAWRWFIPPSPPRMMDAFTDPDDPHTPDPAVMRANLDAKLRFEERERAWEKRQQSRLRRTWNRARIVWTETGESCYRAEVGGAGIFLLSFDPDDAFDDARWELRTEHQKHARLAWWDTQPTQPEVEAEIRRHLTDTWEQPHR